MKTRIRPQVEPMEKRSLMTAGVLDTTFGGTGYVLSQIGSDPGNSSRAVAVQPNLDVVVVGSTVYPTGGAHSAVERFTPGGALDPSFGQGGVVNLPFTTSIYGDVPYGVALQANGDIVVIASVTTSANVHGINTPTGNYWGVARLLPGGAPDPAFGTSGNGMVLIMKSTNTNIPKSVASLTNGQIVVEGQFNGSQLALARLNADGSLDTTFGSGGIVVNPTVTTTTVGSNNGVQAGMAVDASGRIVVTGIVGQIPSARMAVLRYNANGTPDITFGVGGMTTALPAGFSYAIGDSLAIQSTGAIVVDGTGVPISPTAPSRPLILARFTPGGSLDTSFGSGGYFVENRLAVLQWSSVAVQGNDEIVVLDRFPLGLASPMVVTRVLANGSSTDTSFGTNGLSTLSLPNFYGDAPGGVVIAPDGKIVVTGVYIPSSGPGYFAVARFLGDSPPAAALAMTRPAAMAPAATQPEGTLIPFALDDPAFLDSLAKGKRRPA